MDALWLGDTILYMVDRVDDTQIFSVTVEIDQAFLTSFSQWKLAFATMVEHSRLENNVLSCKGPIGKISQILLFPHEPVLLIFVFEPKSINIFVNVPAVKSF